MIKRSLLLIGFVVITGLELQAQSSFTFYVKGDYDFFSMTDLKNLQDELLSDYRLLLNVPIKATDSYPAYYGIQVGFLIPISIFQEEGMSVGGYIDYTSTGGRIHYQDYSGEVKLDQIATAYSFGAMLNLKNIYSEIFLIDYNVSARLISSKFKNSFLMQIGSGSQTSEASFHSFSIGIEPRIVPSLKLQRFSFGLAFSYLICLPTSLEYDNYDNAFLVNKKGDKVSIDWSGFKVGIIIFYSY